VRERCVGPLRLMYECGDGRETALFRRCSLFFVCSVRSDWETETEADSRISHILKQKSKPKIEKTDILARFSVKKWPV
jgi:hypothetical protein